MDFNNPKLLANVKFFAGVFVFLAIAFMALPLIQQKEPTYTPAATSSPSSAPLPTSSISAPVFPSADIATARAHFAEFERFVRERDPKGLFIQSMRQSEDGDTVIITVTNAWQYEGYRMRLQLARVHWQAWAGIHSPNNPDKARIKLLDITGDEVGGYSLWKGVWVSDR